MKKFAKIEHWNGFKIAYLAERPEFLGAFKRLYETQKREDLPSEWHVVADKRMMGKPRMIWAIDDDKIGKVLLKRIRDFRPWNLDHFIRSFHNSMIPLVEATARERANGYAFPMQHFLVAERREFGHLREYFLIAEFVEGENRAPSDAEWLKLVLEAHAHGFCWKGDPNLTNFILDGNGNWRGIDIFVSGTWKDFGRDLHWATTHAKDFYPDLKPDESAVFKQKLPECWSLKFIRWQDKVNRFFRRK